MANERYDQVSMATEKPSKRTKQQKLKASFYRKFNVPIYFELKQTQGFAVW